MGCGYQMQPRVVEGEEQRWKCRSAPVLLSAPCSARHSRYWAEGSVLLSKGTAPQPGCLRSSAQPLGWHRGWPVPQSPPAGWDGCLAPLGDSPSAPQPARARGISASRGARGG